MRMKQLLTTVVVAVVVVGGWEIYKRRTGK
jgi:hypothetical protein